MESVTTGCTIFALVSCTEIPTRPGIIIIISIKEFRNKNSMNKTSSDNSAICLKLPCNSAFILTYQFRLVTRSFSGISDICVYGIDQSHVDGNALQNLYSHTLHISLDTHFDLISSTQLFLTCFFFLTGH